jgi:hypothetical protein
LIPAGRAGYKSFGHKEDHGHDPKTDSPIDSGGSYFGPTNSLLNGAPSNAMPKPPASAQADSQAGLSQWAGDVLYYKEHVLRHDAPPSEGTPLLAGGPGDHDILDFSERKHLRRIVKNAMESNRESMIRRSLCLCQRTCGRCFLPISMC